MAEECQRRSGYEEPIRRDRADSEDSVGSFTTKEGKCRFSNTCSVSTRKGTNVMSIIVWGVCKTFAPEVMTTTACMDCRLPRVTCLGG